MIVRARTVVPVTAPSIPDGAVWVSGHQIRAVGPYSEIREVTSDPVTDLGEVAVFPGLVNAHAHFDYTDMAGLLVPPREFPDWIKGILTLKSQWTDAEFEASWLRGAREQLESGTTTVANIETRAHQLAGLRARTPLRVFSFLEMTGIRSGRDPGQIVAEAIEVLKSLPPNRGGVGLSPHAPYSTSPELLRAVAALAREEGWRVTCHVAESEPEFDMFMYRRGSLFSWLQNQRPNDDCGLGSPVQHVHRHGLLDSPLLAVHVNCLWGDDARRLAARGASVVHCPRSHAYFGHPRFQREELTEAGVPICIGTDSLASTRVAREGPPVLSLIDELRSLAAADPGLSPRRMLAEVTVNPARALGLKSVVGELRSGALADLLLIPHAGSAASVEEAIVHHRGPVAVTMIGGRWEWIAPGWAGVLAGSSNPHVDPRP
ncbi:MAG: amidohydrolase family protein [Verrucomicrobiota bacterium]